MLFWIEDNAWAISTKTPRKTFYSLPDWCDQADAFYGLPITRLNGRNVIPCARRVDRSWTRSGATRRPGLVIFEVDRLSDHTNSDDERVYRSRDELEHVRRRSDPIRFVEQFLNNSGVERDELEQIANLVAVEVRDAANIARRVSDSQAAFDAKKPIADHLTNRVCEYRGDPDLPRLTLLEAVREVLRVRMADDSRITLYGQDIEDPKGDVFGITEGLTLAFPDRVTNAPLTESTIVGVAIGRALAGGRPVAFIQFADFLPLAFNQIIAELGVCTGGRMAAGSAR